MAPASASSVFLGMQLAATYDFVRAATTIGPSVRGVSSEWYRMQRDVLEPLEISPDTFHPMPQDDKELPAFATQVRDVLRPVFGRGLTELASRPVTWEKSYGRLLTPEDVMKCAAAGIVPGDAANLFCRSAAEYLSRQLDQIDLKMDTVLFAATDRTNLHLKSKPLPNFDVLLCRFLMTADIPRELMMTSDAVAVSPGSARSALAAQIESSLMLLYRFGPHDAASFFERHDLHFETIDRAVKCGVLSAGAAHELYRGFLPH